MFMYTTLWIHLDHNNWPGLNGAREASRTFNQAENQTKKNYCN